MQAEIFYVGCRGREGGGGRNEGPRGGVGEGFVDSLDILFCTETIWLALILRLVRTQPCCCSVYWQPGDGCSGQVRGMDAESSEDVDAPYKGERLRYSYPSRR